MSQNIDLIILTETWTNDFSKFDLYKIRNYNRFSCSRENSIGGGVMIYVNNRHTAKLVSTSNFEYIESVSISLTLNQKEFLVHSIYRPPNSHVESFIKALESLLMTKNSTIIAGDFNINKLKVDNTTNQFMDVLSSLGASISNQAITRNASNTIIDYVITQNLPEKIAIETFTSSTLLSSDHNMLLSLMNVKPPKSNEMKIIKNIWNYEKLNNVFDYDNRLIADLSATKSCTYMINCIQNAMNHSSSLVEIKSKSNLNPPWADLKYHRLMNTSMNILKKINKLDKHGKPTSRLRRKLNDLKNTIDDHSNIISKIFYSKLINTNSKHSWNVINSILGRKKENRNITLQDKGNIIQNPLEIAEMFNERFSAVSRKIPNINTELQYNGQIVYECIYLDAVSSAEVYNIICELDSNKAAGSDGIPCIIIKALKDCIINKIISEACYPDILKLATVVPVYKKGDSQDPKNYRPISLLPIVNKIFEKIILNKILDFMDTMEIKNTEQYGYKKSIGTSDAILKFCHNISSYLDSGDYCIAIFMDLSSAFDTLNREVLLEKLSYLGIKGHASSLLESYFANRTVSKNQWCFK